MKGVWVIIIALAFFSGTILSGSIVFANFDQCGKNPPQGQNKGAPFLEIWAAICDLQNQINALELTPGPTGPQGEQGEQGPPGDDGTSCTVTQNDGSATITCEDGSSATVFDGQGINSQNCPAGQFVVGVDSSGNIICDSLQEPTCPNSCSGNGVCFSGTCTCDSGWTGADCSIPEGSTCGNGTIESGESCDDGNVVIGDGCGAVCQVESGFVCVGSPSVCSPICGDNIIAGSEACDGNDLGGETCQGLGFESGTLACNLVCTFDTSGCVSNVNAVYVSKNGNDANPGTQDLPRFTINAGIARAGIIGANTVIVSEGTYNERVILQNGISLLGGYSQSNGWTHSVSFETEIVSLSLTGGRVSAIEGNNITLPTTIDDFVISSGDATSSASSYGLYCNNCDGLIVSNNEISSGNGGAGTSGTSGNAGVNGASGGIGNPGCENSSDFVCDGCSTPQGGFGGGPTLGLTITRGGNGGFPGLDGNSGLAGQSGGGGAPGGAGGAGGGGGNGQPGANGANAPNGANGGPPANGLGSVSGNFWFGFNGQNGQDGLAGGGAGGGGGGGGGDDACDSYGSSGGGGGAGGTAGTAATGGTAGGGSFGVFLIDSTGTQIFDNIVLSRTGGNGGQGGIGGNGGVGGAPGLGGPYGGSGEQDDGGNGGPGGRGGDGGDGGHGSGGAGGVSYAVYKVNTVVDLTSNTLLPGSGGVGGFSAGNPGPNGASGNTN